MYPKPIIGCYRDIRKRAEEVVIAEEVGLIRGLDAPHIARAHGHVIQQQREQ